MRVSKRDLWSAFAGMGDPQLAFDKLNLKEPAHAKRVNQAPEQAIVNAILARLKHHPKVAWCVRMNAGAYKTNDGRFIRFGFIGCPDIWGQMRGTGKLLTIEVKSKGSVTDAQRAFLERVRQAGGHAGVARSLEDAERIVEGL